MAYNSDGYIMIDFTEVDFRRTNQTIEGLFKRCVDVIGTNKFILVINANGRTPLPATCSFTNNQYVIDTCIYMFAISSNDNLFIRRNDVPASDIIDDSSISVDKTWSSNKIDSELDGKQDTLTAGTNITIDENNVISSTGGAVIDDSVIVNNKVWSSLNTVEKLAPIDTIVNNPAVFNTSLELPLVECSTSFMASQEGTGDPSPSNVRPIHGFSEVNLVRTSGNLWDEVWENGQFNWNTGIPSPRTDAIRSVNFILIKPNTNYYIYNSLTSNDLRFVFYGRNKEFISVSSWFPVGGNNVITTPANAFYMKLCRVAVTSYDNTISVNYPSTDTAYHPYTGNTYTIQLGEEIYGAEVDVVTGEGKITWHGNKLSDLSWTRVTSGVEYPYFRANFSDYKYVSNNSNIMCEVYKFNGSIGATGSTEGLNATSDGRIRIRDNSYSDKDAWLADVGNHIIAYELSTPFDIQLTPTQIETLIGNNTIFADTGNIKVSYRHLPIDLI